MPSENIWDAAIALNRQRRLEGAPSANVGNESTLLVVGSKSVGKVRRTNCVMC